ncbi:Glucose dehydrogenase [FAD, quinone] [Anthophora quadrimaculata]
MRLYILLSLLVQLAYAFRRTFPFQTSQVSDTSNETSGCCLCSFRDTSYMESKCGVKTSFMNLVEKVISSRCDISDPCNRLGKEEVPNEWFDFIVVGAGMAGPIIARRLSDNPWWRVLLIEAGPEEPSMTSIPGLAFHAVNSSLDWNFKTEPTEPHPTACLETDGVCTWPRGKMVSGTSVAIHFSIKDTAYEAMTMDSVNEYLETRTGPLTSTGLTQVTAFLESSYAVTGVPDIQVFFDGFSPKCPRTGLEFECLNGALALCSDRRQIVMRPTAVTVASRGYMKLRSGDPAVPPLIYPNYFVDTKDLKVLVEGIKKAIELTNTQTMKQWDLRLEPVIHPLCTNYHFASDAYWECYIRTATGPENHQSGTCKMGAYNDPTAVVDPELRVRGVSNIRVADASVFPIVPNSNPIAAIMMTAEKAADMIRHTWMKM